MERIVLAVGGDELSKDQLRICRGARTPLAGVVPCDDPTLAPRERRFCDGLALVLLCEVSWATEAAAAVAAAAGAPA